MAHRSSARHGGWVARRWSASLAACRMQLTRRRMSGAGRRLAPSSSSREACQRDRAVCRCLSSTLALSVRPPLQRIGCNERVCRRAAEVAHLANFAFFVRFDNFSGLVSSPRWSSRSFGSTNPCPCCCRYSESTSACPLSDRMSVASATLVVKIVFISEAGIREGPAIGGGAILFSG